MQAIFESVGAMSFAYLFPGQGCQTPNMAQWILNEYPVAYSLFKEASKKLCYDVKGSNGLQKSEYCQPTVLLTSYCYYRYCLDYFHFKPRYLCGHSLGEFTALVAAEALDLLDALALVKFRGKLMDSICAKESGGMLAVINLPLQELEERIRIFNSSLDPESLPLVISGFSSPKEFVVSGPSPLLAVFQETLRKDHVVSMPLQVAGAFHHPMMAGIKEAFAQKLGYTPISKPRTEVFSSTTETLLETPSDIKLALIEQIDSPVRWMTCVERLLGDYGVDVFVDVGPRAILQRTIKDVLAKQVFKLKKVELVSLYSESGRKKIENLKGQGQLQTLNGYLSQLACTKTRVSITPHETKSIIEAYSYIQKVISLLQEPSQTSYIGNLKFKQCQDYFIKAMVLKGCDPIEGIK